jgi:Domain of Unknown Function (DUF1080)
MLLFRSFYTLLKFNLGKYFLLSICCLLITSCKSKHGSGHNYLSPPADDGDSVFLPAIVVSDSGWTSLSGENALNNWHTYGKKKAGAAWNIDSSSIHLKPTEKDRYRNLDGGDLVSNDTFGNFDLKLEWKIAPKANSGIIIFVREDPANYKETWNTGPEMQVCDIDSNEDAHIIKHEAGDLYDLIASRIMSARPAMEWNQVEIVSYNQRLDFYLNDVHIISTGLWNDAWKKRIASSKFKDMPGFGSFPSGHIALQDHGGEVWYRNIKIKKID